MMGRKTFTALVVAAAALGLAGCKDSPRPLHYNKGEYIGKPDTPLTKEQRDALRHRGRLTYQ
ncbi:MAG: hypothetical protein Kow0032_03170 [Methyloligellaceae bacterium]